MISPALGAPAPTELRATAVLLDLDGTITDSASAIMTSIRETFDAFGYPQLDDDTLLRFIGPPIREALAEIAGVAHDDLDAMVDDYRGRYSTRMVDVPLFPGVRELIRSWHAAGIPLALATAKLQHMAEPIIDRAGLTPYFTAVCGDQPKENVTVDGVTVKADVVARALAGLAAAGADVSGAVMVGDRFHDVAGAARHGVETVLVGWGYGRPGEGEGAVAVVHDSAELAAVLGARASAT
ncbi:HAD family hydrolase [Georgenia halophila]|uniref:HAD family hydrolase n=1 Tax=Georgenia halophila TaxID=620889 RepID=A0ABP8L502_9MICO